MIITILVDNNTLIDRYYLAEPGLSLHIRTENQSILFDLGYSDIFIRNALKLGINLYDIDHVVFSHGHLDHTWGLDSLIRLYNEAGFEGHSYKTPAILAHPKTFERVMFKTKIEFGSMISEERLTPHFRLDLNDKPVELTPRLMYLGEIPRVFDFENQLTFGRKASESAADRVPDDTALAYASDAGLVIITGCSHSGICNIIEHAKNICGVDKIADIIGGLHLIDPPASQLNGTVEYLKKTAPTALHACHCTDLASKIELSKAADLKEVGVGMQLTYS
ncbi:MAG: MBL fold metallo-hydrolase [Desulfobacteraceae bacterium]|nr:MBL fold metallo-hydrolase [Desulfobacteraceae bacterium]